MPVPSNLEQLSSGFDDIQNASYEINLALGESHPVAKLIQSVIYVVASEVDKMLDQLRKEGQIE